MDRLPRPAGTGRSTGREVTTHSRAPETTGIRTTAGDGSASHVALNHRSVRSAQCVERGERGDVPLGAVFQKRTSPSTLTCLPMERSHHSSAWMRANTWAVGPGHAAATAPGVGREELGVDRVGRQRELLGVDHAWMRSRTPDRRPDGSADTDGSVSLTTRGQLRRTEADDVLFRVRSARSAQGSADRGVALRRRC